jgi:hypothetical protein
MQAVASIFTPNRLARILPWLAAALLIAGLVVFLVHRGHNIAAQDKANNQQAARTYHKPLPLKAVKLSPAARLTAGKFIIDAVQRQNLPEAWKLAGPELKVDTTYKQWLTGNISVIPFTGKLASAPLKIDVSRPRYALLEVALVPKSGKMADGGFFFLELKKFGTKWKVTSWVPRGTNPIPVNPAGA